MQWRGGTRDEPESDGQAKPRRDRRPRGASARSGDRGDPGGRPPGSLLRTDKLTRHFRIGTALSQQTLHAVDEVSLTIGEREIVALAGESGSGKSTIARLLAKIYKPTSGEIYFQGKPLSGIRSRKDRLRYSGLAPMVFQDPFASINPVFRVSHGVLRGLKLHRPEMSHRERYAEARRVFEVVGLTPADEVLQRYPHELSGGQRQRVGFAQALAMRPKLILADEPVSMLDVSIRIGLLNMMAELRDSAGRVDPLHHARPGQRPVRGGPAGHHVRGPRGRVRARRGSAGQPPAPVHPAAAVRGAGPARTARRGRGNRPRRATQGDQPDPGLPVPLALPAGHRRVPPGHPGTDPDPPRPPGRLPCRPGRARK